MSALAKRGARSRHIVRVVSHGFAIRSGAAALHRVLAEPEPAAPELILLTNVTKRVRLNPDIQDQVKLLRDYLQQRADTEDLFNRAMVLWASSKLPGALTPMQRQSIVEAVIAKQHEDGGWACPILVRGNGRIQRRWKHRAMAMPTGLITLALQKSGLQRTDARVSRALAWLLQHQDSATGMWTASSLNKKRDPETDPGKFMSDAATAYAVLALVEEH